MNYYMPRSYPAKPKKNKEPGIKYSVSLVWAAAAAAHRINGNSYVKLPVWNNEVDPPIQLRRPNREIVAELLAFPENILPEDYVAGENCLQWIKGDLTFRALKNKLTDFDLSVQKALAIESEFDTNFDKLALAVIPSLPASYARGIAREETNIKLRMASDAMIGAVSDKVTLTIEVLNSNYSHTWNVWFITGIDSENRRVFFSYRNQLSTGSTHKISGTVKAHRDDSTQLNRVKML